MREDHDRELNRLGGDLPGLHWCVTAYSRSGLVQLLGDHQLGLTVRLRVTGAADLKRFAAALAAESLPLAGDEPPAGAVLVNIGELREALLKVVERRKFRVSDSKKTKGTVVSTEILVHAINRLFSEVQDGKR